MAFVRYFRARENDAAPHMIATIDIEKNIDTSISLDFNTGSILMNKANPIANIILQTIVDNVNDTESVNIVVDMFDLLLSVFMLL